MIKQRTYLTGSENKRIFFLIMTGIITVGIIIGACIAVSDENFIMQNKFFHQYISPFGNGNTLLEILKNTFFSVSLMLMIIFFMGFFSIGQPFALISLIYRGFGIGLSVASVYMSMGKKGIYIVLLFVVPKILATSVIMMLGVREAVKFSNIIYSYIFRGTFEDNMEKYVKLYCVKFLVLIFFIFLTAVADSSLNYFFGYLL